MIQIHTLIPAFLALLLLTIAFPFSSYAECATQICVIIDNTIIVFDRIVTILFILESAVFIYGAITKVINPPNIKQQAMASQYMLWSIIAMAATVAAWGFARILIVYFGIGGADIPTEPGPIS